MSGVQNFSLLNMMLVGIGLLVLIIGTPLFGSTQNSALAFPSTVTTTTDSAWDQFGSYHKMIIANDGSWHLFYGENTVLKHTASSDGGVTWTTPDVINSNVNQNQVDVDYIKSGSFANRIQMVYASPNSGANIIHRYANVTGTSLSYSPEHVIGLCGNTATYYSSITVTGTNKLSIVYGFIGNSNGICEVTSTDGGSTFGPLNPVYQTSGWDKFMRLLPISSSNDDEMIVWTNLFAYNDIFSLKRVAGTWDTFATTLVTDKMTDSTPGAPDDLFSADYDSSNNIHLVYIKNDNTLQYLKYSGSWSAPKQLDSSVTATEIDTMVDNNGNVYVFYVKSGTIYFVKSTNSGTTWSNPTSFATGETSPQRIVTPHHGFNTGMSTTLPVFWIAGTASPFNIRVSVPGASDDTNPATLGNITGPTGPVQVNTQVNASDSFTDNSEDTHTATWNWGDGVTTQGTVTESGGSGSVQNNHTYNATGVYTITLTVNNSDGASSSKQFQYVVVYDPNGGFVTGSGWIISPVGAYIPNVSLTGKATFGFVSKYQHGSNVPTGNTEFIFQTAGLSFHSTSYQWLVISGAKAQYKGSGMLNGVSGYNFLLTATDSDIQGGGIVDGFRLKITDSTGSTVYDNQIGTTDDLNSTTQPLGGGDIIIHKS